MLRSVVFGQGPDADITVNDPYVSARHCRVFEPYPGIFYVEDLGSTNGTRVLRGRTWFKVMDSARLEPGDIIMIGRTVLPWVA